jgi:predicted transposase/invertase (TIGR01784 family)
VSWNVEQFDADQLFFDEKLPDPILKELMEMDPVIKRAEERLEWLNSDAETQRLYEACEHSLIERNSLISEGKAEGKIEGKIEVVLTMLSKGLDGSLIRELTGFSIDDIERLRDRNPK